jgi:hypothetical protein
VKQVQLADGTGELVDRSLKPNFRALGPSFQQRAPRVAEAIRSLASEAAASAAAELAGEGVTTVEVDGEPVTLTAEMAEIVETPRTGWAVAAQGATSFALDTELTRPLEVEGAARELVRAVNDQRKAAGLALDDRIELIVEVTPAELDEELASAGHYDVVAREVLATAVHRSPATTGCGSSSASSGPRRSRCDGDPPRRLDAAGRDPGGRDSSARSGSGGRSTRSAAGSARGSPPRPRTRPGRPGRSAGRWRPGSPRRRRPGWDGWRRRCGRPRSRSSGC